MQHRTETATSGSLLKQMKIQQAKEATPKQFETPLAATQKCYSYQLVECKKCYTSSRCNHRSMIRFQTQGHAGKEDKHYAIFREQRT